MPLIFSKSKETHNHSVKNLNNGADKGIVINNCDQYLAKTATYTPELNYCNSKDSSMGYPNEGHASEDFEEDLVFETTALKQTSEPVNSFLDNMMMNDNYLTVSGTIKRGKKKGQSVEVVLNMSREELEILEVDRTLKHCCHCDLKKGMGFHIFLWTIFCFPLSVIISGIYSFCMGTITWYNVFKFFSENQKLCYRISIPPLLMILYPFLIISTSLGLGLYSGVKQLSCCWDSWKKEFTDYEKGFFGWLCNSLDVPECSPYEVVILSSIQKT